MAIKFLNDGDFPDNAKIRLGDANDLEIYHDGTDSTIENKTGDFIISNNANDKDILFKGDTGGGGLATYFFLDGSLADGTYKYTRWVDYSVVSLGTGNDLQLFHDSTKSRVENLTGNLEITQKADDSDIIFNCDDGSGSTATYFSLDGSAVRCLFSVNAEFSDNVKAKFGSGDDLEIYHNGSNSIIEDAGTGDLVFKFSNDLLIEGQDGANLINCNEGAGVQLYHNNNEKLETQSDGIQVTGNIDIDSNGEIELDGNGGILLNTAPSGNEGNGIIIKLHSSTTVAGSIYYKSHLAAAWSYTTANDSSTTRMLAVALGTNSGTDGMLLQGIFRKASHGFSAGAPLYIGATNGTFTTTAPSTGGQYARVVGYVVDSNHIYFSPGTAWVEVG
tara:strand:- start:154 stop:1320 length:1167 start_codon:yes stop_codon:yes gene_type:complete